MKKNNKGLNMRAWCLLIITALFLAGCSSSPNKKPTSRYSVEHDYGPDEEVDVSHVKDAVPRVEPLSRGGNKSPYRVLGRTYHVMNESSGYKERGGASWYGKKFHGHLTSNGEVYDMYGMSAAHKSLPLPTYVRVTNLANGKQVVVRVNDRGPFHSGRIIDLSYAAASKLGMLKHGTARVEVEAINPRTWQSPESNTTVVTAQPASPAVGAVPVSTTSAMTDAMGQGKYIQVGAYSQAGTANRVAQQLTGLYGRDTRLVNIQRGGQVLYRVLVGPINSASDLNILTDQLNQSGYPGAHPVDYP
jgi:rare lipoprotein A